MISSGPDAIHTVSARVHNLLNISVNHILTGKDFDQHCHSNLTRAILPYHLTEFDVHDVLNVVRVSPSRDLNRSSNALD